MATASAQWVRVHHTPDPSIKIPDTDVRNWLAAYDPTLTQNGSDIAQLYVRSSPFAHYYTFQQQCNGIPIQDAIIKVRIAQNASHVRLSGAYCQTENWHDHPQPNADPYINIIERAVLSGMPSDVMINPIYIVEHDRPVLYYTVDHQFTHDRSRVKLIFNAAGELVNTEDFRTYFSMPDTLVHAKVFLPDPVTSAETDYAGDYKDFDDADNDALNNERFDVMLPAQFEDGVFYLRTDSILLTDLNAPTTAVVTSLTDTFHFTRSQSGFEDVNTLFHLTYMVDHLTAIGYASLPDFYIEVDPHGASGADQSFYVSAAIPSIQYGEGGVDDAEDADVIIHEFAHALSDHASPGSNTGLERRAIDEGYGDYFAVSHSRAFSNYKWEEVFTWDGHNEFWFGRNADTDKHYPEDNSDNFYAASEIWSGALMDIFDLIGKDNTDMLVCESLYGSIPNMTMPEAAQAVLDAEALIFAGMYEEVVFNALDVRGLIDPVSVESPQSQHGITFANTLGFAGGDAPLIVSAPAAHAIYWEMHTITGAILSRGMATANVCEITRPEHYSGLVVVTVRTADEQASITAVIL